MKLQYSFILALVSVLTLTSTAQSNSQGRYQKRKGASTASADNKGSVTTTTTTTTTTTSVGASMDGYGTHGAKSESDREYERRNAGYNRNGQRVNKDNGSSEKGNGKWNNAGTTNNPSYNPTSQAMNGADFADLKNSVERQSFSDTKMTIAKQGTKGGFFTASQIREMMNLFTFETNKLEYAKFAYTYCIEKNKYYQVNDVFSFSSSVDELNKYLETVK